MPPFTTGNPLIDRPTQRLIANARGRFEDTQRQLQQQQQNLQTQAEAQRELLGSQFTETERGARSRELQQRGQEQQNIQDQIRTNRIRARAIGGAPSSGFLELTGRAEREGARRLAGITGATEQTIGRARGEQQRGLAALEQGLSDAIFQIENNRAASRREKDQAIAQLEQAAAQQALALQEAARNRATAGGGGGFNIADLFGGGPGGGQGQEDISIDVIQNDPNVVQLRQLAQQQQQAQAEIARLQQGGVTPFEDMRIRILQQQLAQNVPSATKITSQFAGQNVPPEVRDAFQQFNSATQFGRLR
jgi:hypothetical protein